MDWIRKHFKQIIYIAFLFPILFVAYVSISHVTKWYAIGNPISWAIYLSVAVEIAALASLAAIVGKMGKSVYFPFILVTIIQFIGNVFYSYQYIDINGQVFKDWVDLVSPLVVFMGIEPTDLIGHKRLAAFLLGGMLPVISLSFLGLLVKFEEKDWGTKDKEPENKGMPNTEPQENQIESQDLMAEISRARLSEDELKKLDEMLKKRTPRSPVFVNDAEESATKGSDGIVTGQPKPEVLPALSDEEVMGMNLDEHERKNQMTEDDFEILAEVIQSPVTPTPEISSNTYPPDIMPEGPYSKTGESGKSLPEQIETVINEEPIVDMPPEVTDAKKKIINAPVKESVTTSSSTINKKKVPKVGLIDSKRKISTLPTKTFIRNVNNSRRQRS